HLWGRRADLAAQIQSTRENATFLPGCAFPATLTATHELDRSLHGTEMVLVAVPTPGLHEVLRAASPDGKKDVRVVRPTKGIAIAAGASDGMGFGHNSRAALITRGLAEIAKLAVKLGGEPLTLAGLAGMGDLVLTCTGDLSRNRHVGFELGKGRTLPEVLGEM